MQGAIANTERLAIYVLDSDKMKSSGVRWRAFMPSREDNERSFFRTDGLTAVEIAEIGQHEVAQPGRPIKGWAELSAQNVLDAPPLQLFPDEPPPRHGVIVNWPPEIQDRQKLAMTLAKVAIKHEWAPPANLSDL